MHLELRKTLLSDLDQVIACERKYPEFVGQWDEQTHTASMTQEDCLHLTATSDGSFAGFAILKGLTNPSKNLELMRIAVEHPSRGSGRELICQVKELAFVKLSAHRLWLDVREKNLRAQKAYEAAGFVKEGLLRECVLVNGAYESLYIMSVLKHERGE